MDENLGKLPPYTVQETLTLFEVKERQPWHVKNFRIDRFGDDRGRGVKVGVVDTGVDSYHQQFGDLVGRVKAAKDFTGNPEGAHDGNGHGTGVAGVIAAVWDNNIGIPGMACCDLYVAKALNDKGIGRDKDIAAAILWCGIECGCQLINVSAGSAREMPATAEAIRRVTALGCTVVVAAGNEGDNARSYPALMPEVISVASINKFGQPSLFSSPSAVDVACPGEEIDTLWAGGGYATVDGTSFAAPWFTGFAAIWFREFSIENRRYPTPAEAQAQAGEWCIDIGIPGDDVKVGHGMISADRYEKLRDAKKITSPPVAFETIKVGELTFHKPAQAGDKLGIA